MLEKTRREEAFAKEQDRKPGKYWGLARTWDGRHSVACWDSSSAKWRDEPFDPLPEPRAAAVATGPP